MGIQEQEGRARQRVIQKQAQAVNRQAQVTPRTGTIGAFQPNGKFAVNLPDGGQGQGVKIYNSRHDEGDTVLLSDRGDGTYILDGPKAPPPRKELNIDSLDNRCKGYLNGQIFHCEEKTREAVSAWAIGKSGATYYLVNLITGSSYPIVTPPTTIQPCATPPPNAPPGETPSPPSEPNQQWYLHIWYSTSGWPTPTAQTCGNTLPPVPPNAIQFLGGFDNVLRTNDGQFWDYRFGSHSIPNPNPDPNSPITVGASSAALSTYTKSPTPPPIPTGALDFAVISSGQGWNGWSGSHLNIGSGLGVNPWIYVSAGCLQIGGYTPQSPLDNRDPNAAPIPNTIEATISIGQDLGPIAMLRHTPNCISPGVWNYEKSFRVENNALSAYNGRLSTDWRYTVPAIPCQATFKTALFTNLDFIGTQLWSIEPPDRPATLTPGTPFQLKVTKQSIAPTCATTVTGDKTITAQVTGSLAVTIVAIAVKIIKR